MLTRRRRRRGRPGHRRPGAAHRAGRPPVAAGRGLPLRPGRRAVGRWRRAGGRLLAAGRHPHGRGRRRALPHQRRAVLLPRVRQARGHRRARQGPRRRVHGARLRADGLAGRQLVPHLALPLRRGGTRVRRPARDRGDRRDSRRRPQHGPGRRDLRQPGVHDLLRGHHQRRHAGGPPAGDPRARRPRQEPPVRGGVEHRERAGVRHPAGAGVLRAAGRRDARGSTPPARSASST